MKLAGDHKDGDSEALMASAAKAKYDFEDAMNDDFNTALAISVLFELVKDINIYLKKDAFDAEALATAQKVTVDLAGVMGIELAQAEEADDNLADALMDLIINIRKDARANKNFQLADQIRDGLTAIGITLEYGKAGTTWSKN